MIDIALDDPCVLPYTVQVGGQGTVVASRASSFTAASLDAFVAPVLGD